MVPTNMRILRNVNFLNLVQMGLIEAIKTIIWTLRLLNTPLMYNHARIFFFESNPRIDFKYNIIWAEELCRNICNNFWFRRSSTPQAKFKFQD